MIQTTRSGQGLRRLAYVLCAQQINQMSPVNNYLLLNAYACTNSERKEITISLDIYSVRYIDKYISIHTSIDRNREITLHHMQRILFYSIALFLPFSVDFQLSMSLVHPNKCFPLVALTHLQSIGHSFQPNICSATVDHDTC